MNNKIIEKLYAGNIIDLTEAGNIGECSRSIDNLEFRYAVPGGFKDGFLGSGGAGAVYSISDNKNLAAKIYHDSSAAYQFEGCDKITLMKKSFSKQKKMHEKFGCFISKPYGIYNVYDEFFEDFLPALVMERLPGKDLEELSLSGDFSFAGIKSRVEQKFTEMEVAGYDSWYNGIPWKNVVYDFDTGNFGFVDFDLDKINF